MGKGGEGEEEGEGGKGRVCTVRRLEGACVNRAFGVDFFLQLTRWRGPGQTWSVRKKVLVEEFHQTRSNRTNLLKAEAKKHNNIYPATP